MAKSVLVFQDLALCAAESGLPSVRRALIAQAMAPWSHATEKENEFNSLSSDKEDFIVFFREGGDGIDTVGLFLWANSDRYEVTNIVPRDVRELGIANYNAALQDFIARVVEPAKKIVDFSIEKTSETQSLDDWIPSEVGDKLRRFSALANKSTGSSHPLDRKRWFEFLFAIHNQSDVLGTDRLVRWLVEIEGWREESARDLAIEYEFGLELLKLYDQSER